MTWKEIGTTTKPLTPDEHAAIDDVLDAAVAWQNNEINFYTVATLGGIDTPPRTRALAIRHTSLDDPRRPALMALFDAIIRAEGLTITRQGVFSRWEIRESDGYVAAARVTPVAEGRVA